MAKEPKLDVEDVPADLPAPAPPVKPTDPAVASFLDKVLKRQETLENDLVSKLAANEATIDKQKGDLQALANFITDNATLTMDALKLKAGAGELPASTKSFSLGEWVALFVPDVFSGIGELLGFASKAKAPEAPDVKK